jgi:hypothetical protein
MVKVALTIPAGVLRPVERLRIRLGKSRGAVVTEALGAWLKTHSVDDRDARYKRAYLREPERAEDQAAVAFCSVSVWDSGSTGESFRLRKRS